MKKLLITIFTAAYFFFPSLALAHTLQTSGSVGAIIHIDPEDDPIIGKPASIYFDLKDTSNKFSIENCTCFLTISLGNSQKLNVPLEHSGNQFTFPERGLYTITLSGSPKDTSSFSPFTLSWDFRITKDSHKSTFPTQLVFLPILFIIILVSVIIFLKK